MKTTVNLTHFVKENVANTLKSFKTFLTGFARHFTVLPVSLRIPQNC